MLVRWYILRFFPRAIESGVMKGIEDKYLGASQMISDEEQTVRERNYILKKTMYFEIN